MNTIHYLEMQLTNINVLFHDIVGDLTEQEWVDRAAPGQNRLGFITWHIPRTHDAIVQAWIRGEEELFYRPEWSHWRSLKPFGLGAGITLAEADSVATTVHLAEVLTYADILHQEMLAWLRQCSEADLDQVPDAEEHLASLPEYQAAGFRAELQGMFGQPVWNMLMRPCIGHIHRHLGELQLAKDVLRAR